MLRNPPVLVLDEATSALDVQTERAVEDALRELAEGRTTIVIAHRLSTVRDADQIVVLDGGAIAERGTHDELLAARRALRRARRPRRGLPRPADCRPEGLYDPLGDTQALRGSPGPSRRRRTTRRR